MFPAPIVSISINTLWRGCDTAGGGQPPTIAGQLASLAMPARRNLDASPNEYLADGGTWPEGPLKKPIKAEAAFLMEIARRLKEVCDETSHRAVARAADLDVGTVINIINGDTWCEVPTIYRLEKGLQMSLWQRTHIKTTRPSSASKRTLS